MAIKAGDIEWNITGDTSKLEKALDAANSKVKGFADGAAKAGKAITAFGVAGGVAIGGLVMKSQDFSKAMAEVNTLGVKDLGALSDAVKDVSKEFGLDLTDSAKAAYQAISAGASEAETPRLLEQAAIAATAGVTDLSTAIELGTSVTNAFGTGIGNASQVFDEAFIAVKGGVTTFEELSASVGKLSPLMSAAGVSSAEMFASIGALTKGGIATSEAVTGMKAAIQAVIKPTSEAQKMAEQLGIQWDVASLQAQGLGGFMNSVKEATGGNIEVMSQLFGSVEALNSVLALTGNQAASFNDLLGQMANSTGASQAAFDAFVAANPGFAFAQLKAQVSVLAVELGDKFAPILLRLVEKVKPIITNIIEWIRNNEELAGKLALLGGAVVAAAAVIGPLLVMLPGIATAFSMVSAAIPFVGAALVALTGPVGIVIAAVVAVAAAVAYNWDWVSQKTNQVFTGIGHFLGSVTGFWIKTLIAPYELLRKIINLAMQWLGLESRIPSVGQLLGFANGGVVPGFANGGKVEGFASGGQTKHRLIQVGERGPELMAAPVGSRVMSHPDMMTAVRQGQQAGGTSNIAPVFNITINDAKDPNAIMDMIKKPFSQWAAQELAAARR